jgi:hypothetical protein
VRVDTLSEQEWMQKQAAPNGQPSIYRPGVSNRDRAQAIKIREDQWRADLKIRLPLSSSGP